MELNGCGAVVTGGASGLGQATAELLRAGGAVVAVIDRRPAPKWDGPFFTADVSDAATLNDAVAAAADTLGRLSIGVNCAGTGIQALAVGEHATLDARRFTKVLEVNTTGTFNFCRAVAEVMQYNEPNDDGERGVLINTASTVALEGQIGTTAYAASKAGVIGMTLPLARELAPLGIRVMTIAPGIFDTAMFGGTPPEMRAWLEADLQFPRRLGRPAEFAALVRHIVENVMLNGETIRLDAALRVGPGAHRWSIPDQGSPQAP
jgi:NAD(P)-dependent dehydrogenase (short-subunit alcohol dehydrogenase family)